MPVVPLIRHPSTPCPYVREFTVRVDSRGDGQLTFQYRLEGDIDELQWPPQRRSAHADGLWKQTCLEAFVRVPGARGYIEFNFSPSSEWAVYAFDDYREGMRPVSMPGTPKIICRRHEDSLEANVDAELPTLPPSSTLELAISAVLRDRHDTVSYWALAHPHGKPDFHHRDGYALKLALNGTVP
jgi:hypothetical protein